MNFFMVRVGSLFEKMQVSEKIRENKTNMTCREQLSAIFERVRQMLHDKDNTYRGFTELPENRGRGDCRLPHDFSAGSGLFTVLFPL